MRYRERAPFYTPDIARRSGVTELLSDPLVPNLIRPDLRGGFTTTARFRPKSAHTVLIVDDDDIVRHTFAQILRSEGYQVRTAKNADSGLRRAADCRPDAIVLDFRMPVLNGLGSLRKLRGVEAQLDIPVAIITGDYFLDDQVTAELEALGAVLYFKPLWLEDLVALVDELLRGPHRCDPDVRS